MGSASSGAHADQLALELGLTAEHGLHKAAVCHCGIGSCVAKGAEASLLAGDRGEGVESIEPGDRGVSPSARHPRRAGRARGEVSGKASGKAEPLVRPSDASGF